MSATRTCSGEPISWLRLERLRLGELPTHDAELAHAHLAGCEACSHAYAATAVELDLLPLPAATAPTPQPHDTGLVGWLSGLRARLALAGVVVATAAVLLIVLRGAPGEHAPGLEPPARSQLKGGELALTLVRSTPGGLAAPTHFAPGDRFKVLVTCPPALARHADVVVYQAGQAYFPLPPTAALSCGNRVALPGAFSLTGDAAAVVCVVLGEAGPVDRDALRDETAALPELSVCERLLPAGGETR